MIQDDDLLDALSSESAAGDSAIESATDATLEDTEESSEDQPEQEISAPNQAWVDHVPVHTHKVPDDLTGKISEYLDTTDEILKMKELYKLATLEKNIHDAYYRLWVRQSNSLFRLSVMFRRRIKAMTVNTPKSQQEQEQDHENASSATPTKQPDTSPAQ